MCSSSGHCTGLFGSRFQVFALLTGPPSSSLWLSYPFVPFIQRPFVSRDPAISSLRPLLRCLPILSPFRPSSHRVCPIRSRLLMRESRRYVAVFLPVLFWRTSGGWWHADKGNLLSQEISGGKRGWLAPAVRLIYLFLVT